MTDKAPNYRRAISRCANCKFMTTYTRLGSQPMCIRDEDNAFETHPDCVCDDYKPIPQCCDEVVANKETMNGTELVKTLSKCTPAEIRAALLEHPDVIAVKLWTKDDVRTRAAKYVAELGEGNEWKVDAIVEYVLSHPWLFRDVLSDCTEAEWGAIDSAISKADEELSNSLSRKWSKEDIQKSVMVSIAAQEVGL